MRQFETHGRVKNMFHAENASYYGRNTINYLFIYITKVSFRKVAFILGQTTLGMILCFQCPASFSIGFFSCELRKSEVFSYRLGLISIGGFG